MSDALRTPASESVARAESIVGSQLRAELAGYFHLARDLTDLAGDLTQRIGEEPSEFRALHVGAVLLSRTISDLIACVHLVKLGYAPQAITLVATMLELVHVAAYVGNDEARAAAWIDWSDRKKSYPGLQLVDLVQEVAKSLGVAPDRARRDYDEVYREACIVKHGNPMGIFEATMDVVEDTTFILFGPIASDGFTQLAHAAMQWATRYGLLAVESFMRYHFGDAQRACYMERLLLIRALHEQLTRASIDR